MGGADGESFPLPPAKRRQTELKTRYAGPSQPRYLRLKKINNGDKIGLGKVKISMTGQIRLNDIKSETYAAMNSRLWHPSDAKHVLIINRWLPAGLDVVGWSCAQTVASYHKCFWAGVCVCVCGGGRGEAKNARKEFNQNQVARTRSYLFKDIIAAPDADRATLVSGRGNVTHVTRNSPHLPGGRNGFASLLSAASSFLLMP